MKPFHCLYLKVKVSKIVPGGGSPVILFSEPQSHCFPPLNNPYGLQEYRDLLWHVHEKLDNTRKRRHFQTYNDDIISHPCISKTRDKK